MSTTATVLSKLLSVTPSTEQQERNQEQITNTKNAFRRVVRFKRNAVLAGSRLDLCRTERFFRAEYTTEAKEIHKIFYNADTPHYLFAALALFENKERLENEFSTAQHLDFTKMYAIEGNKVKHVKFFKNGKISLYFISAQAAGEFFHLFDLSTLPTSRW